MKYLTTKQVADLLGVSPRRVRQMAEERSIKGEMYGAVLVWDIRSLSKFERRPSGRPRMAKGNR
jgi:excisionase family DNA binding protein